MDPYPRTTKRELLSYPVVEASTTLYLGLNQETLVFGISVMYQKERNQDADALQDIQSSRDQRPTTS